MRMECGVFVPEPGSLARVELGLAGLGQAAAVLIRQPSV